MPDELIFSPTASPSATTRPISPLDRDENSRRTVDGPEDSKDAVSGPFDLFSFSATSESVSVPVKVNRKVCDPLITCRSGPEKTLPVPRMPRSSAEFSFSVSAIVSVPVPLEESAKTMPSPSSLSRARTPMSVLLIALITSPTFFALAVERLTVFCTPAELVIIKEPSRTPRPWLKFFNSVASLMNCEPKELLSMVF